jgi:hypothetical protein
MSRVYPRQAWVLLPSFKPKEVTLVKPYCAWGSTRDYDVAESGKHYHKDELHLSQEAAIAAGRVKVAATQANIDKRQENLNKQIASLDKADKSLNT